MLRVVVAAFAVFFGLLLTVSSAFSADLALVLGNSAYRYLPPLDRAAGALNSAVALRKSGYTVISGRNLGSDQATRLLEDFIARLGSARHAVVLLNGRFVHSGMDTWFLPVNAAAKSLTGAHRNGISLNLLLDVMSAKPGRAAIFLGSGANRFKTGLGLKAGIGKPNIPQGVFLATGTPKDIDLALQRDFLASGQGFADALASAPKTVAGFGFVSNVGMLSPADTANLPGNNSAEEGYWQAVNDIGGEKAMNAYLQAYPDGAHAPEARAWLNGRAGPPVAVVRQPKDIEAELGLSRAERRNIQRDLSNLGYDTRGIDGYFGRGSRSAIANWQADQGDVPTGFLSQRDVTRIARQSARRAQELAAQKRQQQAVRAQADQAYWISSGAKAGHENGLRRYLQRYPNGLYARTASRQLNAITAARQNAEASRERDAWDNASRENSIYGYQTFLSDFPNGYYSGPALRRLNALQRAKRLADQQDALKKKDQAYWASSGAQAGQEAGLRAYLRKYPNGIYASEARNRLNAITAARKNPAAFAKERNAWNVTRVLDTPLAYQGFLTVFPNGVYAAQARQRLKELKAAGN